MIKIKYTIVPSWTFQTHSDVIKIHDEELEGLSASEREAHISKCVNYAVDTLVGWDWEEVEDE